MTVQFVYQEKSLTINKNDLELKMILFYFLKVGGAWYPCSKYHAHPISPHTLKASIHFQIHSKLPSIPKYTQSFHSFNI